MRLSGYTSEAEKLARFAGDVFATEHAEHAIAFGWTAVELFGLHHGDLTIAARRADTRD